MDATNFPITRASFNLTRACNLACDYCFTNGCTKGSMSDEIARRAVDFLFMNASCLQGPERVVEISFWGGEPLIEWELLKKITLYAKAVSKKIAVPVQFGGTTNGTLLTPEKFDFLDVHRILFLVSWDGGEESHNMYRKFRDGRGSWDIVAKNIKDVLKRWPFYRVRISLTAENIHRFFEDCKTAFDIGVDYLIFSPVYEGNWTDEKWDIWIEQSKKIVDYMASLRAQGRKVEIQHFRDYTGPDNSKWPCGAGRFYVGIDIDGAIYPCHRFNKFDDERPWQEKEICIGHVDHGITRPNFRKKFIDFNPLCGDCERLKDTPCHGGCYAVNFDFTGDVEKPYKDLCKYISAQIRVSKYYKEKLGSMLEQSNTSCICNFTHYDGPEIVGFPLPGQQERPKEGPKEGWEAVIGILLDMSQRLKSLEEKIK